MDVLAEVQIRSELCLHQPGYSCSQYGFPTGQRQAEFVLDNAVVPVVSEPLERLRAPLSVILV